MWLLILAAEAAKSEGGSSLDLGQLAQYGVLGLVVLALIMGQLVPGYLYKQEKAERERMTRLMEDKVLPALIESTRTLVESERKRRG